MIKFSLPFVLFALLFSASVRAQLVILQYHHVSANTPASTSISPEGFAGHLLLLEQENMHVIDLGQALAKIRAGESLPEKSVAITFDDAYRSVYDNAYPLLKQRNWPFTVFVNTNAVDEQHGVVMDWKQLKELQDNGALIANHSAGHPYLIERPDGMTLEAWLTQEVAEPEARLQKELGTSHKLLAYPYGEFDLEIIDWLAANGYLAFGQQSGPVGPMSHPQALPRFPASGIYANVKTLKTKLYTLALPVPPTQLIEPVLAAENPPTLAIHFPEVDLRPRQIQCFASGEGAISTQTEADNGVVNLTTRAENPIRGGRSRYNCTAPSVRHPGWYYWYSQLWINSAVKSR